MNVSERKRVQAAEMNCLRNICSVRRIDRVRNEQVCQMCGKNAGVCEKIDQKCVKMVRTCGTDGR